MPKVRAVYDTTTKSYRGATSVLGIIQTGTSKSKPSGDDLINGSPFGPYNPSQPIDGTPYREKRKK